MWGVGCNVARVAMCVVCSLCVGDNLVVICFACWVRVALYVDLVAICVALWSFLTGAVLQPRHYPGYNEEGWAPF